MNKKMRKRILENNSEELLPSFAGFYILKLKECAKFKNKECQFEPVLCDVFLNENLQKSSPEYHLFFKIHKIRGDNKDKNFTAKRVLFVMNIPTWASVKFLKVIFGRVGKVKGVIFRKLEDEARKFPILRNSEEPGASGSSCHIIFSEDIDEDRVYAASTYSGIEAEAEYSSGIVSYGIKTWILAHKLTFPQQEDALTYVNKYMSAFDQAEKEKKEEILKRTNVPDEEGFLLVPKEKATRRLWESDMQKIKKRNKELTDFYRFQVREVKKEQFLNLYEKFENDKKRIQELKNEGHYEIF